jgi:hypothetical protein
MNEVRHSHIPVADLSDITMQSASSRADGGLSKTRDWRIAKSGQILVAKSVASCTGSLNIVLDQPFGESGETVLR